jgi:hypothetical protein
LFQINKLSYFYPNKTQAATIKHSQKMLIVGGANDKNRKTITNVHKKENEMFF